jgi:hypothetical protein
MNNMLPCLNVCIGYFSLNQHSVESLFSLSVYAASQRALTGVVESLCFTDVDGSVLELPHTHWIKWDSKTWQVFLIIFLDAINKPLKFKIFKGFGRYLIMLSIPSDLSLTRSLLEVELKLKRRESFLYSMQKQRLQMTVSYQ